MKKETLEKKKAMIQLLNNAVEESKKLPSWMQTEECREALNEQLRSVEPEKKTV